MILRIFPVWATMLGLGESQLVGVDLPLQAPRAHYREMVDHLKGDPLSLAAVITSHKINLYMAASDLFDYSDRFARLSHEVSRLVKRDNILVA